MNERIPEKPLRRTFGSLDAFIARTKKHHLPFEAAPGVEIELRGWILDPDRERVDAAWIELGDSLLPLEVTRERHDVAHAWSMTDRSGGGTGFEHPLVLPDDLSPGLHDARIVARTRSGEMVASDHRLIGIAHPRRLPRPFADRFDDRPSTIRIGDTQTGRHSLGFGPHQIRQEGSLRITGRFEPETRLGVIAESLIDAVGWEFDVLDDGRFEAILWTGDMERGVYRLIVGSVTDDGPLVPLARCAIAITGPHHHAPLHLPRLITKPAGEIIIFEDAALRPEITAPAFISGREIAIAGWCLDPVANEAPLAVYLEIDDLRPLPLSCNLPAPPESGSDRRCGFGGVFETTRLDPGDHRLRILACAVSGAGWYVLDERTLALGDYPRPWRATAKT